MLHDLAWYTLPRVSPLWFRAMSTGALTSERCCVTFVCPPPWQLVARCTLCASSAPLGLAWYGSANAGHVWGWGRGARHIGLVVAAEACYRQRAPPIRSSRLLPALLGGEASERLHDAAHLWDGRFCRSRRRRKQHSERKRAAGAVRNVLALVNLRLGYLEHVATWALPIVHAFLFLEGHIREKYLFVVGVVIVPRVRLSHAELRRRTSHVHRQGALVAAMGENQRTEFPQVIR